MSNPVDEYLSYCAGDEPEQTKEASLWGGAAKSLTAEHIGGLAMDAAILGGGAALLSGAAGKIYGAITKRRDFNDMMDVNPDLKEYQRENPKLFNAHYSSLRSMNQEFASDPVVAGTYMRQMSMSPGTAGKVVAESLGAVPRGAGGMELMAGGGKEPAVKFKF
jgi:hypothetical protein